MQLEHSAATTFKPACTFQTRGKLKSPEELKIRRLLLTWLAQLSPWGLATVSLAQSSVGRSGQFHASLKALTLLC